MRRRKIKDCKRLFDIAPETRLLASAYTPQVSHRVYRTLCRRAADALAANYSVIIDAVSPKPADRRSFAAAAAAAGVPFLGLWLVVPAAAMDRRSCARRHDASDASPGVLAQQLLQDAGTMDWVRIDADAGKQECLSAARRALAAG